MRRKADSPLEDIFQIATALPWWAGVGLALVLFGVLHNIAGTAVAMPTGAAGMADFAGKSIGVTLAKFGQWVVPIPLLLGAAVSAYQRRKRNRLHAQVASSGQAAIDALSWQEFEMLVGEAFRQRGFTVLETGGGGADGGVDLVLSNGREKYLVQCKQWRAAKVGVTIVRELYGVMAAKGATGGFVVTSGTFSAEARDFAKSRNIDLIDGPKLTAMISKVQSCQRAGETLPTAPRVTAPPPADHERLAMVSAPVLCSRCGAPMVKRIAKKGANAGKPFWGCSAFPQCREIRSAD